jgi:hypothetical protein
MDELLERLRARLAVPDAPPQAPEPAPEVASERPGTRSSDRVLEQVHLLMREAEQLRRVLSGDAIHSMSQEEQDDLCELLDNVLRELRTCEARARVGRPY